MYVVVVVVVAVVVVAVVVVVVTVVVVAVEVVVVAVVVVVEVHSPHILGHAAATVSYLQSPSCREYAAPHGTASFTPLQVCRTYNVVVVAVVVVVVVVAVVVQMPHIAGQASFAFVYAQSAAGLMRPPQSSLSVTPLQDDGMYLSFGHRPSPGRQSGNRLFPGQGTPAPVGCRDIRISLSTPGSQIAVHALKENPQSDSFVVVVAVEVVDGVHTPQNTGHRSLAAACLQSFTSYTLPHRKSSVLPLQTWGMYATTSGNVAGCVVPPDCPAHVLGQRGVVAGHSLGCKTTRGPRPHLWAVAGASCAWRRARRLLLALV